jgi:hypothetical protein
MPDTGTDRVRSVNDLLDRIEEAADEHDPASLGDVLDIIGHRSFGPLLLFAGIVMVAPVIGDIPGVPVLMGLIVILTAGQFLLRRDHFWLPGWLARRSVSRDTICKAMRWIRPVGRFLDRWSRPRLTWMTHGAGVVVIAAASAVIAAATPLMEVVPFSANVAGLAITAYGLALIASDGLIAALALAFSAGTFYLIVRQLFL